MTVQAWELARTLVAAAVLIAILGGVIRSSIKACPFPIEFHRARMFLLSPFGNQNYR
jgi:hypothetical protein